MIARVRGTLLALEGERAEVATPGGVVYEVEVPLSVVEHLPAAGEPVEFRTVHLVREDAQILVGFMEAAECTLFRRLLTAQGVGVRMAIALLSTYSARRLVRALVERDVAALVQVPGVGKKTAERLILELTERVTDLEFEGAGTSGPGDLTHAAVQALISLGLTFAEADQRVRAILRDGERPELPELIRKALAHS